MTTDTNPTPILIACSSRFKNNAFFKRKLNSLTKNTEGATAISVNDVNGFIDKYSSIKVIDKLMYKDMRSESIKKVLQESDKVIIFWDGSDLVEFVYNAVLQKKDLRIVPVETTKVVNRDKGEKFDVYIGRGTPWGNPFALGESGSREEVIEKFKEYFIENILGDDQMRKGLLTLKGLTLGCHCKPLPCHGDVIADYLNSLDEDPPF